MGLKELGRNDNQKVLDIPKGWSLITGWFSVLSRFLHFNIDAINVFYNS